MVCGSHNAMDGNRISKYGTRLRDVAAKPWGHIWRYPLAAYIRTFLYILIGGI